MYALQIQLAWENWSWGEIRWLKYLGSVLKKIMMNERDVLFKCCTIGAIGGY